MTPRSRSRRGHFGLLARLTVAFGTMRELHRTLVDGGRWWLVPMLGVLALAALLLAAVAAVEYVAPFVYTVF